MKIKSSMNSKVVLGFALIFVCATSKGEYTDSCGLFAQMLWSAADGYDSAKSSYESACNSNYGYNKNDETACGSSGFERSSYQSAMSELNNALVNVGLFCGPCDQVIDSMAQASKKQARKLNAKISLLKGRIEELETENEALSNKIQPTQ